MNLANGIHSSRAPNQSTLAGDENKDDNKKGNGLDHIFIRMGPAPPLPRLLHCPVHVRGNSSPLGTNVTIPSQNYKYSSQRHFRNSPVN